MPQTLASLSLLSKDNDVTVNELHELNVKTFQNKNYRCNIENMKVKKLNHTNLIITHIIRGIYLKH